MPRLFIGLVRKMKEFMFRACQADNHLKTPLIGIAGHASGMATLA